MAQRRRIAAMCGLVAAAAGILITTGVPAPAAAISEPVLSASDWKLVTALSGSNGAAKWVTATCPAGMQVVGAGGRIVDTGYGDGESAVYGGRVSVVDMVPNPALTSVTVTGGIRDQSNWDAAVDTFQVEATARCARTSATAMSPAVVTGLTRVTGASPANGTADVAKTATATCPVGTTVYGTGFRLNGANGKVFVNDVVPDAGLTTVTVTAYDDLLNHTGQAAQVGHVPPEPFVGVWDLQAYAVCGVSRGQDVRLMALSTRNGIIVDSVQAPQCTPGTLLTGVGVDVGQSTDISLGSIVALKTLALAPYSDGEDPAALPSSYNRASVVGSAEMTNTWWMWGYSICH